MRAPLYMRESYGFSGYIFGYAEPLEVGNSKDSNL